METSGAMTYGAPCREESGQLLRRPYPVRAPEGMGWTHSSLRSALSLQGMVRIQVGVAGSTIARGRGDDKQTTPLYQYSDMHAMDIGMSDEGVTKHTRKRSSGDGMANRLLFPYHAPVGWWTKCPSAA